MTLDEIRKALTGEPIRETPTITNTTGEIPALITFVSAAQLQQAVDEHRINQDPEFWAKGVARFVCDDGDLEGKTRRSNTRA